MDPKKSQNNIEKQIEDLKGEIGKVYLELSRHEAWLNNIQNALNEVLEKLDEMTGGVRVRPSGTARSRGADSTDRPLGSGSPEADQDPERSQIMKEWVITGWMNALNVANKIAEVYEKDPDKIVGIIKEAIDEAKLKERQRVIKLIQNDIIWDDLVVDAIDTSTVGWSDEDQFEIFVEELRDRLIVEINSGNGQYDAAGVRNDKRQRTVPTNAEKEGEKR